MEKAAKGLIAHFSIYRGLPKGIYVLFVAQIINAVGNLVYPFLTFFLTQRLGYGSATAGMFILILSAAYMPGSLIGGKLADVIGRKKVLVGTQGMAALAFVIMLVPESKPSEEEMENHGGEDSDEKAETGGLIPVLMKRPFLLAFSFIALLLTFVYSQFTFSLPLQLKELFQEQGPLFYGTLMTVNALVVIFCTTPLVSLTKKVKPVLNVAFSAVLFTIGFGVLYFIHSLWLFVLSTVVWTLGEILQATNTNVYIANHTPISHHGRFNSILPIIIGTGFALGPPVMGQYVEAVSVRAVWPLAAGISLFGAAALVLLYMKEKQRRRVEDGQALLL
ncbi:MAG: MFS transporter [Spirochaetota bacterium]|nr:MFS transporter [Spirochaetota bacterium]